MLTPSDSPATGFSPAMRSRNPKRVFQTSHDVSGTISQRDQREQRDVADQPAQDAGQVGDEEDVALGDVAEHVGRVGTEQAAAGEDRHA